MVFHHFGNPMLELLALLVLRTASTSPCIYLIHSTALRNALLTSVIVLYINPQPTQLCFSLPEKNS